MPKKEETRKTEIQDRHMLGRAVGEGGGASQPPVFQSAPHRHHRRANRHLRSTFGKQTNNVKTIEKFIPFEGEKSETNSEVTI